MRRNARIPHTIAQRRPRRKNSSEYQNEPVGMPAAVHQLQRLPAKAQASALGHLAGMQREQTLQRLADLHGNQYVQGLVKTVQLQEEEAEEETDRIERQRANWGELATITVNEVPMEIWGANETQLRIIENTLTLLPEEHIRQIPRVVVGERVGPIGTGRIEQGGNSARSGPPELQRLEITVYALEHKLKRIGSESLEVCFTLLHETGHWVDWNLTILPPRDSEEWETLNAWFEGLDYGGATQGPGERAAEAYWRYFAGRLPEEIRQIIDASPAFETLRQELDRD